MNKYELMAANIERAYIQASRGQIQARVWDVKITPVCARFRITVGAGVREKAVTGLNAELAYNLGVPTVRIVREGGEYFVEVPREVKRALALTDLLRQITNVPPYTALLGVQTDSTPLLLRIDSPDVPHALLAGTTGSGKTALLRTLLLSLALYNRPGHLMLALIDPKGRGLAQLAPLRHIWRGYGVAEDPADAATLLDELVGEMERRDRTRRSLPRIVVAIDEFADLLDANRAIGDQVQRLTQRGREAGIHVIVATQRPTATLVGSMLKANLPVRMIGKVVSPEEAKIAAGIKETGAELLQGRGDFLLVALGHTVRFQAAYALPRDVDGLVTLATTGVVDGRAHPRRAWGDLPLQLPPALPRPAPAPLPAPRAGETSGGTAPFAHAVALAIIAAAG